MRLHSVEHLSLPRGGESVNGDAVVVRRTESHHLLAIIDALGHGARAAVVANAAVKALEVCRLDQGVLHVIEELNVSLRGTRGACALVCILGSGRLEGCSVGNVELRTSGIVVPFVLTPGVLGARVHRPRVFSGTPTGRARLVAYSDGVSSRFHLDSFAEFSTGDARRAIFERHRRTHDDATLLVADVEA